MAQKPIEFLDLRSFVNEQIRTTNASLDKLHKNYFLDTSDRAIKLRKDWEEWRTNIKTPMTLMFVDKAANSLIKMGGRFVVTDLFSDKRGEDGDQIIEEMLELVDRVMKSEKSKDTMTDIVRDAFLGGVGYLKVSYNKEEKMAEYLSFDGKKKTVKKIEDEPVLDYVSPYNLFPYYHSDSLNTTAFIAERILMTREQIEKKYAKYFARNDEYINTEYQYISYIDYNAVKSGIPFYGYMVGEHGDMRIDDSYKITDKKKLFEVIELHTTEHMWVYVNGAEFWPFQSDEQKVLFGYRYRMLRFRKISGSLKAIGLGHFLSPLQHEYDAITNARIDNVLLAVNKMMVVSPDANLGVNSGRFKTWPWKTIKADPNAVRPFDVGEIPWSSYRETDVLFWLAQATTGVSGLSMGLQNKVERVAGSHELLKSGIDDQLIEVTDSMARLRSQLMKDILVLTLAYMSREQLNKFLGDGNKLSTLDIETIINDYEFSFEPDTESTKMSAVTLQLLINYLNTAAGLVDGEWRPVIDAKKIAEKIKDAMGITGEFDLSPENMVQRVWAESPVGSWEEMIRALQQGGAGDMQGFATNAGGVNTEQPL